MPRALPLALAALVLMAGPGAVLASHLETSGAYTVSFTSKGGNEWWVEVVLGGPSAGQATRVDAMDTGGPWTALTYRSWGAWAASFHVEPGHTVRFRATFPDGTQIESCDWTHPTPTEQCGGSTPPPSSSGFSATFSNVKGNEWWVQAHVTGSEAIKAVDARVNDGAWQALKLQSWGDWAASIHAPSGSLVQLRATGTSGAQALSGHYHWTDGTLVDASPSPGPAPAPTAFNATFHPRPGNEWWVETTVSASKPLARVQARVEGANDSWHDLTLRSWGAWAGSFHVPNGSLVRFRAEAPTREDAVSGLYRWTAATPVSDADAGVWPREGSFVKYYSEDSGGAPDGSYWTSAEINVTLTYQSGRWEALCEGWTYEHSDYPTDHTNATRVLLKTVLGVPTGPRDAAPGEWVDVGALTACSDGWNDGHMQVREVNQTPATEKGVERNVTALFGQYDNDCQCQGSAAVWSARTGLVLGWWEGGLGHGQYGELRDTDAPLSAQDKAMLSPPHVGWPWEGSSVRYANVAWGYNGTAYAYEDFTNVTFAYHDGAWSAACDETFYDLGSQPNGPPSTMSLTTNLTPPMGPLRIAAGDHVQTGLAMWCTPTESFELSAMGKFPESTTREGNATRALVWWADETSPPDQDSWWDTATGLVLRYEWTSGGGDVRTLGRVTNTDAPLSAYQG